MKIVNAQTAPTIKNPHQVKVSQIYDTEHAAVMHITLEPGESLRPHITPVDVFFYVLEGTGIVEIGDEKKKVGPDTLVDSPARIRHCWYNESGDTLRILVAKVPRPTEKTQLL
ncbi:MAG: cupin domain-containing protein [Verrucomicrobiota bacterium]